MPMAAQIRGMNRPTFGGNTFNGWAQIERMLRLRVGDEGDALGLFNRRCDAMGKRQPIGRYKNVCLFCSNYDLPRPPDVSACAPKHNMSVVLKLQQVTLRQFFVPQQAACWADKLYFPSHLV